MRSKTLFPLDEPLAPSAGRPEPLLWLRRLVILRDLDSLDAPIRDIPFRRGLNIVQARQRGPGESKVVGHSVGKTLLMRLIRYSLGEQHFAVEPVRNRIARILGAAHVVAHWRVQATDWIVIRPLQEARLAKSTVVQSDDWRAAVTNRAAHRAFADFSEAVSTAVFAGLTEFTLPRRRRRPKWLDVLGWLARDYECGYRALNDWRHDDAESGPSLDREDNSMILQWMVGLMGPEEIHLKHLHQELLDRRQKVKATRDTLQTSLDVARPSLFSKLELQADEERTDDAGQLLAEPVQEMVDNKIESLTSLLVERQSVSPLEGLETEEATARENLVNAKAEVRAMEIRIDSLNAQIAQARAADSKGRLCRYFAIREMSSS